MGATVVAENSEKRNCLYIIDFENSSLNFFNDTANKLKTKFIIG